MNGIKGYMQNKGSDQVSLKRLDPTDSFVVPQTRTIPGTLYILQDENNLAEGSRLNRPWKRAEHIVLENVPTVGIDEVRSAIRTYVKDEISERHHKQRFYVCTDDGQYSLLDAEGNDVADPADLCQILPWKALGLPAAAEFAIIGFTLIDVNKLWTDEDVAYLCSSQSASDFKTHGFPALKLDVGNDDDFVFQGRARYYANIRFLINSQYYRLCSNWYDKSIMLLAKWFKQRGVGLAQVIDQFNIINMQGKQITMDMNQPRQKIVYGAPGTGKSFGLETVLHDENVVCIRTTFHPDSDYPSFVGAYKPHMKDGAIAYEFVPQTFLTAYTNAWEEFGKGASGRNVVLVIEEINRGNCAQIFGDLFQLLDRSSSGWSTYPINADQDLSEFLCARMKTYGVEGIDCPAGIRAEDWSCVLEGRKLCLPPNLLIWATMNTSDQSLFPIDSAFKRRWDWEYVPINNAAKGWKIAVGDKKYDWWKFLEKINDEIDERTHSEDKKLGYFFVKLPEGEVVIDCKLFVGKVLFYLWNDVFKDFDMETGVSFTLTTGENMKFRHFYNNDSPATVNLDTLVRFFECLSIPADAGESAVHQPSAAVTPSMP